MSALLLRIISPASTANDQFAPGWSFVILAASGNMGSEQTSEAAQHLMSMTSETDRGRPEADTQQTFLMLQSQPALWSFAASEEPRRWRTAGERTHRQLTDGFNSESSRDSVPVMATLSGLAGVAPAILWKFERR